MLFSLVIPVYNEEKMIGELFSRTMAALERLPIEFEIICVDDGSKDATYPLLAEAHQKDERFKVLSLSRNFGHQAAILAGLNHAKGDYIGIMDGDLQDPPELFLDFYNKMQEGYDVVYAVRKKRKEAFYKKWAYAIYYRLLGRMSGEKIPLDSGDFSMFSRRVLDVMLAMPEQSLFLRGIRSWVGFRQTGFEYERDGRAAGETKYSLGKLLRLAMDGIFSFSRFPVKFIGYLGIVAVVFSMIYSFIALGKRFLWGEVIEGYTSLVLIIFFFGGIQLISLRILGEYVNRIYDESRGRPLFIVKDKLL